MNTKLTTVLQELFPENFSKFDMVGITLEAFHNYVGTLPATLQLSRVSRSGEGGVAYIITELMPTDGLFAGALWQVVQEPIVVCEDDSHRTSTMASKWWHCGHDSCSETGQRESLNPSYLHIGLLFSATFLQWFSLVSQ